MGIQSVGRNNLIKFLWGARQLSFKTELLLTLATDKRVSNMHAISDSETCMVFGMSVKPSLNQEQTIVCAQSH